MTKPRNRIPGDGARRGAKPPAPPLRTHRGLLERTVALLDGLQRHSTAVSALCVGILVAICVRYLLVCLSRSWFFSSDEYDYAAEVIRFVNLDPRQHYFDMPGTPFLMLSAALWAIFHAWQTWLSPDPAVPDITAFTYAHLDWFFAVLRVCTVFFWAASIVLLFLLARRLLNRSGAFMACLVLAMSPIYAKYSSFSRVESMAICLALSALLVTYRALEKAPSRIGARPSWRDPMLLAGVLVGAAAAARLHSVAATLPLLLLVLALDERVPRPREYPRWMRSAAVYLLPSSFVAGALCAWWASSQVAPEFRRAAAPLAKAGIAIAVVPLAAAGLYRFDRTRAILLRVAGPGAIKTVVGCAGGFLLANFTVIPQYRYFLASVDMYSASYLDWQRATWPLWANIRWYVGFYLKVFAPDAAILVLLLGSIGWIAVSGNRRLLPYVLAFVTFFVSKPLNLRAAPHHTLLWLPCAAILCAFPAAQLYSMLARRAASHPGWRLGAVGASVALLAAVALLLTNGPLHAAEEARATEVRLGNISEATDWIKFQTPVGTTVAVGYSCFNPDVFYQWMRLKDIPIPASEFDRRKHIIWWGQRRELQGLAGYACVGRVSGDPLSVRDPNEAVDVFHDAAFERVAAFGSGASEVDLFRFDFRVPGAPGR